MYFLNEANRQWIYLLCSFQGIGMAIMSQTASSLISDVIGNDTENSAFVYGCYSLSDKVLNGLILLYCANYENVPEALKNIMAFIPIACSIGSLILTFIGKHFFGRKLAKITGFA